MDQIRNMIPEIPKLDAAPSYADMVKLRTESYNKTKGNLQGYDCPECLNRGYIAKFTDGVEFLSECRCMKTRLTLQRIKESGLENQLKSCTFKNFETDSEWQKQMKKSAMEFIQSDATGFFIGGQSGSGKTHICTAIIGNFIKKGRSARYFVWREDSVILKSLVNTSEYTERFKEFKNADVLYIDDLFKGDGTTAADIKLAFELIDFRVRQCLKTIISTELDENALIACDQAIAGRIFQMSKRFRLVIPKDIRKNYRLRKE